MKFDYLDVGFYWQPIGGNNTDQVSAHSYRYIDVVRTQDNQFSYTNLIIDIGKFDNFLAFDVEGASAAVPDIRFILDEKAENKADAILLTHSHPDHINSIPHYLKMGYKLPKIYSGKFTLIILKDLLKNYDISEDLFPEMIEVKAGDVFTIGSLEIEVTNSSHTSIDSFGFILSSQHGRIFHSGDIKNDKSLFFRNGTDLEYLTEYAKVNKIDAFVADLVGVYNKGYSYKETESFKSLYKNLSKINKHRIFLPVYPTHQQMYLLSFLAALKAKKHVLFYGDYDFYSYLEALKEYGFDFDNMARDRIKVFYGDKLKVPLNQIKEDLVIIGTYNNCVEFKNINRRNSSAIITALSYFNPLKGQLLLKNIKFIDANTNPELQGHGHAHLDEFIDINNALGRPVVLGTHVPVFFIRSFRKLAMSLGINIAKETPKNGMIYKIINGEVTKIGSQNAKWLVLCYENNEIINHKSMNQSSTSGKGYLKKTFSKRKLELLFKMYEKNYCNKLSA